METINQNAQQDSNMIDSTGNNGASPEDMTPEEMAADLKKLMDAVDEKMNTFNGRKMVSDSQLTKAQNDAIAALFQVLTQNGIDPANPDAISTFLQKLQQENPTGYQIFEAAINNLLSQKNVLSQTQPPDGFAEPMNPMDQAMNTQPQSPPDANLPPAGPTIPPSAPIQ